MHPIRSTHVKIKGMSIPKVTAASPTSPMPPSRSLNLHKKQAFWQIWTPLVFGIIIVLAFLALAIISASQGSTQVGRWSDISIMFLILPAVLAGFAFLVLFSGFIFLFSRLLRLLPKYTQLGQAYIFQFSVLVKSLADKAANPIMVISSWWAQVQTLVRRVF